MTYDITPIRKILSTCIALALIVSRFCSAASSGGIARASQDSEPTIEVTSPGGNVTVAVGLGDFDDTAGCPWYRVSFHDEPVLAPSRLGFQLADGPSLTDQFQRLELIDRSHVDSTWNPVWGERSIVRDHFQSAIVEFVRADGAFPVFRLEVRAYDEGAAFRYVLMSPSSGRNVEIAAEKTQFRFTGDHDAWAVYSAQGTYRRVKLSDVKPGCERPLTVRVSPDRYVALAEAALVNFARMKFQPLEHAKYALEAKLDGSVRSELPVSSPWRVVLVGTSPGELLENNDLIANLNRPCAITDTSWIRPGKVIREVTLTTEGGMRCVDFAVQYGLQFVEFDAGWYGHEYDERADATTVTVDPKRSQGPLDLHAVIRYAHERRIGIILYVNRRALERQLDDLLPLYRKWGVDGVKYGFVNVGSQRWTAWLHEAIRKAAQQQLMVDVHDEYRPTGYGRTYPNFMTAEGIGGDETSPTNEQTLTLLFTRMLAGPADNTICYFNERVDRNASHAYQLAKSVCLFSPWQFLFWYDRPRAAHDEPELDFWKHMPTVWDDTKVLHGRIGQYAVIARRHGQQWFIGAMNAGTARTLEIPLRFLPPGQDCVAHIYRDDPAVETRTKVRVERSTVRATSVLKADLTAQGGMAVRVSMAETTGRE